MSEQVQIERKIRLMLLVTQAEMGGAQKYIYLLACHLPRAVYEVTVVCGAGDWLVQNLKAVGARVIVLPDLVREIDLRRDIRVLFQLWRLISREKFDVVHANSSKAGFLGRVAAKLAHVPAVIFTAHGFVFTEPMSKMIRQAFTWMERLGAYFCDAIVAVSEADRQLGLAYKIAPAQCISVIHNGMTPETNVPEPVSTLRSELGLPYETPLIGSIANFYPTKGHRYLLGAFSQVVSRHPETHCVLIGDGDLRHDLEVQIRALGLQQSVHLLGIRDQASRLLPEMTVFVLSSVKEGFPFVMLEAMNAARPIVATRVGGVPEMIVHNETGLLVPPADPNALAEAIGYLLDYPDRAQQFGQAACQQAQDKFGLQQMVDKTDKLYRQLLSRKHLPIRLHE